MKVREVWDEGDKFRDYLRKYTTLSESSILTYSSHIENMLRGLDEINEQNLISYLVKEKRKKHTIVARFALKHYLTMINKTDIIAKLPKIRQNPKLKTPKLYDIKKIYDALYFLGNHRYRTIALIQLDTGARIREIMTLKEENIDLEYIGIYRDYDNIDDDTIEVHRKVIAAKIIGKGGRERPIYIDVSLKDDIKKYMKGERGYLFINRNIVNDDAETAEHRIRSQIRSYYRTLKNFMLDHGFEGFAPHDFRRHFADGHYKQGTSLIDLRDLLGHKSVTTTEIYLPKNTDSSRKKLFEYQDRLKRKNEKTS